MFYGIVLQMVVVGKPAGVKLKTPIIKNNNTNSKIKDSNNTNSNNNNTNKTNSNNNNTNSNYVFNNKKR